MPKYHELGPELQCLLRVKEDFVKYLYFNMLYQMLNKLPGSVIVIIVIYRKKNYFDFNQFKT